MHLFDLNPGEIHFYYICLDKVKDKGVMDQSRRILSREEIETIQAMGCHKKQYQGFVTRALARHVLAGCCHIEPAAVRFSKNRHGKPELAKQTSSLPVKFNLSHCQGLVGCAVALDANIGLDIEKKNRIVNQDLAGRFFSKPEILALKQLNSKARQDLFLDLWTLKEAYVKAVGKGLSLGLDQFSFVFDQGRPEIVFESEKQVVPGIWHFFTRTLLNRWKIAMAVLSKEKERPAVNIHECTGF
ncbi:MAG: 4'-phosphopantetheinyl transferase superfamily protein [Desulfotignum sp.]|nr:4'-phosphopantetheinyl transferase superfamily protein [Desulfotignum sp.]